MSNDDLKKGKSMTTWFWLPVGAAVFMDCIRCLPNPRAAAISGRTSDDAKAWGGNETILLVEGELALRTLAKLVLQRNGYRGNQFPYS